MSLLKKLFAGRSKDKKKENSSSPEKKAQDVDLQEELDELTSTEKQRDIDRAKTEAEKTISDATFADIRCITLIERGRCPECGGRMELMVFSKVCPNCGWYRMSSQETANCTVTLETGEKIKCDKIFNVKGERIICVKNDVMQTMVTRTAIRRIDYEWEKEKLERAQYRFQKERTGVCDWCGIGFRDSNDDLTPLEDYVAFGAFQERHRFCSEKCMAAFRRQYPTRIHRNCYQTDCNTCDECIKRFDTSSFKRLLTPDAKKG
jgi:rubrerythrin